MRRKLGLPAGALVFALMLLTGPPESMSPEAWRTAAAGALMATWWMTEAVPLAATALVPLVLFPMLGILPLNATAAPYANPVIFLFLGGFILAVAMQKHDLHRRIAIAVLRSLGVRPASLVLGFMLATAFLSMWVSNTATAVMMLPIGVSVVELLRRERIDAAHVDVFAVALMLGIAYAASIGGLATIIGTPPNALLAAFMLETYGVEIGFAQWMMFGVPLAAVALPICWILLTRVLFPIRLREIPNGRALIAAEYDRLGPVTRAQVRIGTLFVATALLWVLRPLLEDYVPGLSDTAIAVGAAILAFIIPAGTHDGSALLDWTTAESLPWGVLLLFGGGLALAEAVTRSGLAQWIGGQMAALNAWPVVLVIGTLTVVVILLTELTSNTATAAAFLPLVAPLAIGLGQDPLLLLIPAAVAASCAFMLPVATPPNAIVYGSGNVGIADMARAGIWLNLVFIVLITLAALIVVPVVFETVIEPAALRTSAP